jgi:acyl-CoA reductase-like NAD-dependent aldehyde dehydrogenase
MAAGNATIWKPSPTTPLCSIATTKIIASVLEKNGLPGAVASLVTGGKDVGEAVVEDTGVDMGKLQQLGVRAFELKCCQCLSPGVNMSADK